MKASTEESVHTWTGSVPSAGADVGLLVIRETMNSLQQKLNPAMFGRIHRSRISRGDFTRELRLIDNREYVVRLCEGSEHRSSRTYADQLERWLG